MQNVTDRLWRRVRVLLASLVIRRRTPICAGRSSTIISPILLLLLVGCGSGYSGSSYPSNETYDTVVENRFETPRDAPLSTFSLDVDTASYANVRRFLESGQRPPKDAVRIEELLNYFRYQDPEPTAEHPVAVRAEMSICPWNGQHRLVRIGVRAKDIPFETRPPQNLVFLIDVSGSMGSEEKLPLLQKAFRMLVENLGENDRVAIVVYASATGLVLPSTSGTEKDAILNAIENLQAGGSTNGGAGIKLAYQTAINNLIRRGNNRVILATDGDFNVGVTDRSDLIELVQQKAQSGVFLSVLGFGQGDLNDATMEQLADHGNGSYHYIDSLREAEKVLVRELGGTLLTVAKDVKLQVEFNPVHVVSHRLIGYENRALAAHDFNNDRKDAGDLGAGHTVTALYEIVPTGQDPNVPAVDPLRYQAQPGLTDRSTSLEVLTVKLRYKLPDAEESRLLSVPLFRSSEQTFDAASEDLRFSAAVAGFGMILRDSEHRGTANLPEIVEIAAGALGRDPHGDRKGFLAMVVRASEVLPRDR